MRNRNHIVVVHLNDKEYDRLGLEEEYTDYLGNKGFAASSLRGRHLRG